MNRISAGYKIKVMRSKEARYIQYVSTSNNDTLKMRPIICRVFRYAGEGLDEIRIRVFSTFVLYCKDGSSFKLFLLNYY